MSVTTIVLIVLVLVVIGAFPTWGHSRSWGYLPSGIGGVLIVIMLLLLFTGRVS